MDHAPCCSTQRFMFCVDKVLNCLRRTADVRTMYCLFPFYNGFIYTPRNGGGDGTRNLYVKSKDSDKRPSGIFMCWVFGRYSVFAVLDIVLKEGFGMC